MTKTVLAFAVHVLIVAGVVAGAVAVAAAAVPAASVPAEWTAAITAAATAVSAVVHALLGYFSTVQPPTTPAGRAGAPPSPLV